MTSRPAKHGAGRPWLGRALAITLWATGCAGPPEPTCPRGGPVEVDLEAWKEALVEAVRSTAPGAAGERDRLLGQLALAPLDDGAGEDARGGRISGPTDFQVFPVHRDSDTSDTLVAVRFRADDGAELLRAQLLRPVRGHEGWFCPLGDDLSRDKEAHEEPCLERHDGPARSLAAEPLLAPDRHAVVARDAGGWCGPGTSRADRFATSWWGVEDDRLVRYLEVVTRDVRYESPAPPTQLRRADVELAGGWPRTILVTESVECLPGAAAGDSSCRPLVQVTRYEYTGGSYAAVGDPVQATVTNLGEEETDP